MFGWIKEKGTEKRESVETNCEKNSTENVRKAKKELKTFCKKELKKNDIKSENKNLKGNCTYVREGKLYKTDEDGIINTKGYSYKDFKNKNKELKVEETTEENGKHQEGEEHKAKKGGSYSEVFKEGEGDRYEVHHMPAYSSSYLDLKDGPAIKMEKEDHKKTASWGNSREAREFRDRQRELVSKGNFREALQMDIDDIHEKFGDKYDDAIAEMLEYVDKLELEGKING